MDASLEPAEGEFRAAADQTVAVLAQFLDGLDQAPAVGPGLSERLAAELARAPGESPREWSELLDTVRRAADCAVEAAGPRYLGYIPGGGLVTSALGEFLARVLNRYTGLSGLAPGPVALEEGVLGWLCQLFGLPRGSGGLLTTGGSMAALSALVAARVDRLGDPAAAGMLYVSDQTHHTVAKAARIAGLPARCVRTVPTTAQLRLDLAAATEMIRADRTAGLDPFLLVATAGTTNTGTIDPLDDLAELATAEGLWLHVDACYGGFFQLTDRGHARLRGIEQADSVALDPHKSLFLPYGTGVLLARDRSTLAAGHTDADDGGADYLADLNHSTLPDYTDLGPELTREHRGLGLWLPLHHHGLAAFRDALDEKLDLAARAYQQLADDPRLEVPLAPELTTVVFRPRSGGDAAAQTLLDRVNATRRAFLSSTRLRGQLTLRLSILAHRTHQPHVADALAAISENLD